MSAVKTYLAGGAFLAVVSAIPGMFLPSEPALSPIEIHELRAEPDEGTVLQVRTVSSPSMPGEVPMSWAARVVEASTGATVYPCSGSGNYPYPQGRVSAEVPLDLWVGHAGCNFSILQPGVWYELRATWWADGMLPVSEASERFMVER